MEIAVIAVIAGVIVAVYILVLLQRQRGNQASAQQNTRANSSVADILTLAPENVDISADVRAKLISAWSDVTAKSIIAADRIDLERDLLGILGDTDYNNATRSRIGQAVQRLLEQYVKEPEQPQATPAARDTDKDAKRRLMAAAHNTVDASGSASSVGPVLCKHLDASGSMIHLHGVIVLQQADLSGSMLTGTIYCPPSANISNTGSMVRVDVQFLSWEELADMAKL